MVYVILGIGSYLAILIVRKFSNPLESLALKTISLLDALLSSEDEEIKVKLVQTQTAQVLKYLCISLLLFALAFAIALSPAWLYIKSANPTLLKDYSPFNFNGILAISIGSSIGFFLPKRKHGGAFSPMAKLLHRLILDNYNLHLKLFKREVKRCNAKTNTRPDFVIISGLARAGTTSLLNKLEPHEKLSSLNYGNMPFLLAPHTWRKFYNPKPSASKERSHKDGIMVNNLSPEALEEYFWKAISNDAFIADKSLNEHTVSSEEYERYLDYQMLVRRSSENIYLAKNNNFILRYKSLRKLNQAFKLIIMFREPVSHASSLLDKHQQYSESQKADPFELEYMNWLGHHEFGLGHKPFQFLNQTEVAHESLDPSQLDYWMFCWVNYYTYAVSCLGEGVMFICYEDYCSEPNSTLEQLAEFLNLEGIDADSAPFTPQKKRNRAVSAKLMEQASGLYTKLKSNSVRK